MKVLKVTPEVYAIAKQSLEEGWKDGETRLQHIFDSTGVRIGDTTLKLIRKSKDYYDYCVMPKWHKKQGSITVKKKEIVLSDGNNERILKVEETNQLISFAVFLVLITSAILLAYFFIYFLSLL